jgi:hypothetical protein
MKLIEKLELNEELSNNSVRKIINSKRKIRLTFNGRTYKVIHRETNLYLTLIDLINDTDKLRIYISSLRNKARDELK